MWNAHNTVFGLKRSAICAKRFTSCIQRCLVSRACNWVMSALSAVLLIYSFQFRPSFLPHRSARQHSGGLASYLCVYLVHFYLVKLQCYCAQCTVTLQFDNCWLGLHKVYTGCLFVSENNVQAEHHCLQVYSWGSSILSDEFMCPSRYQCKSSLSSLSNTWKPAGA